VATVDPPDLVPGALTHRTTRQAAGALPKRWRHSAGRMSRVEWKLVRRGWFLGGTMLRGRLPELMEAGMGGHHSGE
jgi:hypothetical protein